MDASRITARLLLALGAAGFAAGDVVACATTGDIHSASSSTGSGGGGGSGSMDAGHERADAADALDELLLGPPHASDGGSDASDAQPDHVTPCPRRPFLVRREPRTAAVRRRADWRRPIDRRTDGLDARTAEALATAWLDDARSEHASIAAFARFTMMMVAVGAPPDLIAGSQRASLDEIRHARDCFALATRYAGTDLGPGPLDIEGAMGPATLEDLAVLTVHEGCVGESIGVLLASEMRSYAVDPFARQALDRIVRDEMRHTELAWRFVRWTIATGGEPVRRRVARAFTEATRASMATTEVPEVAVDVAAWHAHGRVTVAEAREVVARAIQGIIVPCVRALLAGGPGDQARAAAGREAQAAYFSGGVS